MEPEIRTRRAAAAHRSRRTRRARALRSLLSAVAILLAGAGLLWIVRLGRSAEGGGGADSAASTSWHERHAAARSTAALAQDSQPVATAAPAKRPSVLGRIGGTLPHTVIDPRLLVEKSRRTLTIFSAGRPVKTYRVALGDQPLGDKVREGDRRTPEGEFYVCSKNAGSRYNKSLGLSYPNAEDAERGLASGLVTPRERRAIVDAIRRFQQPPWNTRLGGEIMIHGGGNATDWTTGCVALSNADIDELFPVLPLGTPVEVRR